MEVYRDKLRDLDWFTVNIEAISRDALAAGYFAASISCGSIPEQVTEYASHWTDSYNLHRLETSRKLQRAVASQRQHLQTINNHV